MRGNDTGTSFVIQSEVIKISQHSVLTNFNSHKFPERQLAGWSESERSENFAKAKFSSDTPSR